MVDKTPGQHQPRVSRRTILKRAAAAAGVVAGSGLVRGFPTIWAQKLKDITLLQVGGSYSSIIDIARQATKDLGFKIDMQNAASDALVDRVATQPKSLDIADIEYWMTVKLIPRGVLQGIDLNRFTLWDKVVPIFTKGEYPDGRQVSQHGILPYEVQYLEQPDGRKFATGPTQWATLIPTIYNADTLGIRPDLVQRPIERIGNSNRILSPSPPKGNPENAL
jgi:putative spermidine/putrescine transport system substrate-binding protein